MRGKRGKRLIADFYYLDLATACAERDFAAFQAQCVITEDISTPALQGRDIGIVISGNGFQFGHGGD